MRSMTAFARAETKVGRGRVVAEIRSTNHRHLQLGLHLPRECSGLESTLREQVGAVCARGKVDVSASFQKSSEEQKTGQLNPAQLRRMVGISRRLCPKADLQQVLTLPAVWSTAPTAPAQLLEAVQRVFEEALAEFAEQRKNEGDRLAEVLDKQLQTVQTHVDALRERRPQVQQALRERWQARLKELQTQVDAQRVEEEIAVQVIRADVDEELVRLDSHLKETKTVMQTTEPQGRKLDFLMQEFMREANTLAAKAPDVETTNTALAIKVTVEQMREQVQNIE